MAAGMNPGTDGFRVEKSSSSSGAKKLKCDSKQQEEEEDLISNLPEPLLHHIFSFLDTRQAVHTCVLSKRWRYFWVSIPTLNFVYEPKKPSNKRLIKKFADFVDLVLMLRDNSMSMYRFSITSHPTHDKSQGDVYRHMISHLDNWILVALLGNVEELSLDVCSKESYWLPHYLFTSKSLIKLEIHGWYRLWCSINHLTDKISLPRLKTLRLDSLVFIDAYLKPQTFCNNCPSLESLVLCNCNFGSEQNLDICSLKLKKLVFRNCSPFNVWFNLNVPNLVSFHYYNSLGRPKWVIQLPHEKDMNVQHLVHILKNLGNVEDIKLSGPYLKLVTEAPEYLLDSTLTEFCNLRCLMLEDTYISEDFNRAVSYLLKLSPNLKAFGMTTRATTFLDGCRWEIAGFSSDSNCVMMNYLTVFELRDVKGRDCELNFIEVLLKNAKVLERLVIDFAFSSETKESCVIFKETVLAFPRSSLSSTILFK